MGFPGSTGFLELVRGASTIRNASSTVRTDGRTFSTLGVETLLAGLEFTLFSFTKNLKKERRVETFRAIETFLFFRCRKVKYFRIVNRSIVSISTPPEGRRQVPVSSKNPQNCSRSVR